MAALGLISAIIGIYTFILPLLAGSDPLALKQPGTVDDVTFTLINVRCGKTARDLPSELRRSTEQYEKGTGQPAVKGQLCFAKSRIRNDSKSALSAARMGVLLYVGEESFPERAADPLLPPLLFPRESAEITWFVDIPARVSPTGLRFQLAGVDDPGDLHELVYTLP